MQRGRKRFFEKDAIANAWNNDLFENITKDKG